MNRFRMSVRIRFRVMVTNWGKDRLGWDKGLRQQT